MRMAPQYKKGISSVLLLCIFRDHLCLLPHMRVSMLAAYPDLLGNRIGGHFSLWFIEMGSTCPF